MITDFCVVFVCNIGYFKKFIYTCYQLIRNGKYNGNICLIIGDDLNNHELLNCDFIRDNNIIIKYFPNIQFTNDFLIVYIDRNMKKHAELIEIKPANQMLKEKVGKNPYNQAQYVKNMAKWAAAGNWCKQNGINFRVINENDLFTNGRK